jgi:protein-disulfide isomerase
MDRRSLLHFVGGLSISAGLGLFDTGRAAASEALPAVSSPFGVRSLGKPGASVTVHEYFSMNCPHCAYFGTRVLPDVVTNFIKTGKIYYVFKDFPLNEDAVMAAQVARTLPAHEYFPFISELFRTQDQWAFDPNLKTKQDYANALFRFAALAGMDRKSFDAALADKKLEAFILNELNVGEKQYHVNATPTFIINGRKREGAVDFKQFSRWIDEA